MVLQGCEAKQQTFAARRARRESRVPRGAFISRLSGTESKQFPEIHRVAGKSVKLPASVFYEGLRRTGFAVTEENQRFALNAVLLVIESTGIKMVSTDGHRFCFFRMMTAAGSGQNFQCLIPGKADRKLKGLLTDEIRANQKSGNQDQKGKPARIRDRQ
ncbi:MAG TPA: hypothetical protein VK308_11465 [Pyrinomonadaceae bacterium]|nr:hypothetical protein [Pyrinomonadaceae bacterium]